ncbi:MAG: hypothetical protein JWO71_4060 [Candidatus Acidoferrum typicum]|nr:hypothetical protein [Candidatus Acidoferrum typicum]
MVLFLTTLVLLGAMAAAPYVRTEAQREKEQEMIWRGKQYVRGVKLYYRKMGRFPTSVDDLTKPKVGSLRFMRQAYKDPMNKGDGSWRFIYVGPAGQLIGSLKPQQTLQMPGVGAGQFGTPAGAPAQQTTSFGASGFGQSPPAQTGPQQGPQGAANQAGTANAGQPGTQPPTGNAPGTDDVANANPSGLLSDSPVLGGNIIGVGSKINKRSVIIYEKAKNYRLFEFVWNPSKDMANALNQQIAAPNQNPQGAPQGQTGFGFGQQQNNPQNNQQNNQNNTPGNPPANPPEMPMPTPPPQP